MTDYKQLCAELLTSYEILLGDLRFDNRLAKRARAALCAEQKLGELGDEELWTIWNENDGPIPMILRAAIAADLARAALAKPELEEPTDKELDLLADCYMITDGETGAVSLEHLDYARAVLARWGNHPGSPDSSAPQLAAGELVEAMRELAYDVSPYSADLLTRAASLLERLAPQPVPGERALAGVLGLR